MARTTRILSLFTTLTMFSLTACGPSTQEEEPPKDPTSMMEACGGEGQEACETESQWPTWQLEDVQPDSEKFGETYGLEAFDGQVVFVAYLVGWCPYCRAQTEKLEELSAELEQAGVEVQFVTVHGVSANNPEDQQELTSRCSFPVLQDTEAVGAWASGMGGKDDFFIYKPDGSLAAYLPPSSGTNLNKQEDYDAVKMKLEEIASDAAQ